MSPALVLSILYYIVSMWCIAYQIFIYEPLCLTVSNPNSPKKKETKCLLMPNGLKLSA